MIFILELVGGPRDGEKLTAPSNIASVEVPMAGGFDAASPDGIFNTVRYVIDGKWELRDDGIYLARFIYEVPA